MLPCFQSVEALPAHPPTTNSIRLHNILSSNPSVASGLMLLPNAAHALRLALSLALSLCVIFQFILFT